MEGFNPIHNELNHAVGLEAWNHCKKLRQDEQDSDDLNFMVDDNLDNVRHFHPPVERSFSLGH